MFTKSIWTAFSEAYTFPSLDKDLSVDVAIIGGGVTGISAATELAEKGYNVAVLEAHKVGGGTSAHSTGNLYLTIDKNLDQLKSKYDTETIKKITKSRSEALDKMERNVRQYNLDCDFIRTPWYLFAGSENETDQIEKELKAGQDAGIAISEADPGEIPMSSFKAAKVENQAQINPMRYVQELAKNVASSRLLIFEDTRVKEVEKDNELYKLDTTGGRVSARHIIHATHTPKGVKFIQTLLGPYREYGIACKTKESIPEGIFWGYFEKEEKYSIRNYSRNGENFLLVIGKPHKVGQAESNVTKIRELEAFARRHFNIEEVLYRWGGQHYRPADLLPYIGREHSGEEEYIATGYSTDGLVYGTLAGMIIADLIAGKPGEWTDLFDPGRHQPFKAAKNFLKENLNVVKQYLKDLPGNTDEEAFENLAPGQGGVIEQEGEKIAAYKDDNGKLHLCSAVCTHMECIVSWNNAEKTWDCPCHASRFKPDGTVIEGPAYEPLHPLNLPSKR